MFKGQACLAERPVGVDEDLMTVEGVAVWKRIATALREEIAQGALPAGNRLPTEAQLAARFGVNRHTVRRAVEALSRAGLVRVEQGRGSFVAEELIDYKVASRTRFSEWVRRHNKEPSGETLSLNEAPASGSVAAVLGIMPGAPVVVLERLGFGDEIPVSLGLHHFSASRFPGLLERLRAGDGISAALSACGLDDYRRLSSRVSARMPSAREASLLKMPKSQPLLVAEHINVDAAGAVVEFGIGHYPTPRVQIVFEP
jgi:GntR family transcriptional regulator, phosphonate transport system regulatory protein